MEEILNYCKNELKETIKEYIDVEIEIKNLNIAYYDIYILHIKYLIKDYNIYTNVSIVFRSIKTILKCKIFIYEAVYGNTITEIYEHKLGLKKEN